MRSRANDGSIAEKAFGTPVEKNRVASHPPYSNPRLREQAGTLLFGSGVVMPDRTHSGSLPESLTESLQPLGDSLDRGHSTSGYLRNPHPHFWTSPTPVVC